MFRNGYLWYNIILIRFENGFLILLPMLIDMERTVATTRAQAVGNGYKRESVDPMIVS